MAVVRKVHSKVSLPQASTSEGSREGKEKNIAGKQAPFAGQAGVDVEETETKKDAFKTGVKTRRVCLFHESKNEPKYWDVVTLKRFINDRGRIVPRARTGVCAKHQRRLSREIKRARHLSLIPFKIRV